MKKLFLLLFSALLVLVLAACGNSNEENASEGSEGTKSIKIGATNAPHAEILEQAKPLLEEQGIELDIQTFSKYELINPALNDGDLDANFFQHIPYLNTEVTEKGYEIVNAGGVHIEPIGIYSKKFKTKEEIEDGATVIMSSSVPDHGRILALFEAEGLITLKDGIDKTAATLEDIVENPKNLKFEYDYAPDILPSVYNNDEGDLVVINSNYAIQNGINPIEDSLVIESGENNPYVNVIAVKEGNEDKEEIKALIDVLNSQEVKDFILEKYEGAVLPATE
ncbi:MetQ/NlpA family ABC transporter substrate-binding protein [Niallia sp. XMNu-256]|uniref:MetQ/NlpA family ABC transporter substrate-binding protein n=1 Tax=Niallia sp. XMNu-256 TaxID=3082444 RepID=UPI0030D37929